MKRKMLAAIVGGALAGVVALGALAGYAWWWCVTPPLRQALPWSAVVVHEKYQDFGGLNGDYAYELQAKMTPAEFDAYVRRVGLKANPDGRWGADDGRSWTWARYEGGVMAMEAGHR